MFQTLTHACTPILGAAMDVGPKDLLLLAMVPLAVLGILFFARQENAELKERRDKAQKVGVELVKLGMEHTGGIFLAYSQGNLRKMASEIHTDVEILSDPAHRATALKKIADLYLTNAAKEKPSLTEVLKVLGFQLSDDGKSATPITATAPAKAA